MNNAAQAVELPEPAPLPGYYYVGAEIRMGRTKTINARLSRRIASREEAERVLEKIQQDYPEACLWFDAVI